MNARATDAGSRALRVWREEGWRALGQKALAATCYSRLVLLERRLELPLPDVKSPLALRFGLLTPEEAGEYAELVPDSTTSEVVASLRAGARCFTVRLESRLVGVSWAHFGEVRIDYLHGKLRLEADDALIGGSYVDPELRGQRVASMSGHQRLQSLAEAGYRRAVCLVLAENGPAFGPPRALGYVHAGTAHGIGLGRFRAVVITGRAAAADASAQQAGSRRTRAA